MPNPASRGDIFAQCHILATKRGARSRSKKNHQLTPHMHKSAGKKKAAAVSVPGLGLPSFFAVS